MSLRQKAAKGVFWSTAQTWGARLLSFVFLLILARLVPPESFGLVAFATVFIAFAQIFLDQGFSDAIVQFETLEKEHLSTAFWASLITGVIVFAIGVLSSSYLESLFKQPDLAPVINWLSVTFLLIALSSVQKALLRRRLAFKSLALVNFVTSISSGLIAVILAFMGWGVWSLVAKTLINGVIDTVMLWKVCDWRPSFEFSKKHFGQLFSFGINILGSQFVEFFSRRSDDFLIGMVLGPTPLGYYTLAYNLLLTMTELLASVPNSVIFPVFSRIQGDPERVRHWFYEVTQLLSIVVFPIFIGVSLLAPEVVVFLYGKQWELSIPVVQVLMLIGILHTLFYFWGNLLKACGKPGWRFGVLTLISILNVIGFLLVVRYGITAVAATYVVVGYVISPLYYYLIHKVMKVDVKTFLHQYVPTLLGSLAMILAVLSLKYLLRGDSLLVVRLFSCVLWGAFIYLSTVYLVKPALFRQILEIVRLALPGLGSKANRNG